MYGAYDTPTTADNIYVRITAWHEAPNTELTLHGWLGWTWPQYKTWLERNEYPNLEDTMTERHAPAGRMSLRDLTAEVRALNTEKGWRTGDNTLGDYIALIHTEIAEATEAYRDHRLADATRPPCGRAGVTESCPDHGPGKPEGVGAELADVLIRLIDLCDVHEFTLFDMDCELADVAPIHVSAINTPYELGTFGDHMAWLHGCADEVWQTRNRNAPYGAYLLRALVTVAEKYGIGLAAEYTRKMAYNWTRPFQHGGRTLSDPQPA